MKERLQKFCITGTFILCEFSLSILPYSFSQSRFFREARESASKRLIYVFERIGSCDCGG